MPGGTETQARHRSKPCGGTRARDMCSHCSLPSLYILVKTYLPELLTSILSTHSLQNLGATWVLVDKRIHLVYVAIDYYVQSLLNGVVLGDLLGGERLGHGEFRGCATATEVYRRLKRREECRVGDRVESRRTICCVRKAEELVGSEYKSKGNAEGEEPGLYGVRSREVARVAARSWMARSVEWRYAEVDEAR